MQIIRDEFIMWIMALLKILPGRLGVIIRNMLIPYRNGKRVQIWDGVHIDEYRSLVIGDNVSINRGCTIHAGGGVVIGSNVLVGPKTVIYSQNHGFMCSEYLINQQGYNKLAVHIEDDVWIASCCIVLPGCRIRKGCVIAAGAVVTRDTEAYGVYAGNPARLIKKRI